MTRLCLLLALSAGFAFAQAPKNAPQSGRYVYVDRDTVFDTATGKILRFEGRSRRGMVEGGFVEIDPIKGTVTLRKVKVEDHRISDYPNEDLPSYKSPKHTMMTFLRALRRNDLQLARGCFGPKSLKQVERRGGMRQFMDRLRRDDDIYQASLDEIVAELIRDERETLHLHEIKPGEWKFETQTSGVDRASGLLKTIITAQSLYREGDKDQNGEFDYAPNLKMLIQTQLVAEGSERIENYQIKVWSGKEAPEFLWGAVAIPDKPSDKAPYLFTNHTGVVFSSVERPKLDEQKCQTPEGMLPFRLPRRR